MQQQTVTVQWNRPCGEMYRRMGLKTGPAFTSAAPGQFVMVHLPGLGQPLLRRPFSIFRRLDATEEKGIELLYRIVGPVTRAMSALGSGDAVDIVGPAGRGFAVDATHRRVSLVGGGIGIPPLFFLAAEATRRGVWQPAAVQVFLGGRTRSDLLCVDDFCALGVAVIQTTDDGSAGDQCLVTHPVEMDISRARPDAIYACGPMPMLACVAGIGERHGIATQVSVETLMACGIGACLGCAVKARNSANDYLHACTHGPVFDAMDLAFD
ncbi:MAG: dihydroorotate dehydrogenase electron transfer subunit [Pseudomonadota bacterium]